MASRVLMPKLTDTMEAGVLLRWYKQEGDSVESGDVLAEIETDKAIMDLEAYASGKLRKVLVPEGAHVPAGALIAVIARDDEDIAPLLASEPPAEQKPPQPAHQPRPPTALLRPTSPVSEPVREPEKTVKASPLARKLAAQMGVDLSRVAGTGPQGRITKADVERAAGQAEVEQPAISEQSAEPSPLAISETAVPLSPMRRAIARKMVQSKAPVPHFYVSAEIAMDRCLDLQAQLQSEWSKAAPSLTAILIKACTRALRKVPALNASFIDDRIVRHNEFHIGIAVGLEDGLIVPVLRNCERKSLRRIGTESRQLIDKARSRRIQPEEYTGATFSLSNLGMFGVDSFIAVITPPEAAVLAVGSITPRPVVRDGQVVTRPTMRVTLSCDHRVTDGVQAARFLQAFREAVERPFLLLIDDEEHT